MRWRCRAAIFLPASIATRAALRSAAAAVADAGIIIFLPSVIVRRGEKTGHSVRPAVEARTEDDDLFHVWCIFRDKRIIDLRSGGDMPEESREDIVIYFADHFRGLGILRDELVFLVDEVVRERVARGRVWVEVCEMSHEARDFRR